MDVEKKKSNIKIIAAVLAVPLLFCLFTYMSGLLFFKLNHMPLKAVGLMTIWDYFMAYKDSPVKYVRLTVSISAFAPYIGLMVAALIAIFASKQKRALHGDARFATLEEIKEAELIDPPQGYDRTILVGKYKHQYLSYGGYQFVMLAAPTRSGKGVGVVIPNCLNYSDSLVVLDIKLENFDITSGFRAQNGQEVYLFAPFDVNGRTHRYNPLSYISDDPAARMGDIDAIGNALFSGNDDKDKFWNEQAKDLFRGVCLLVLEHATLPKTLGEVLRQASGKGKTIKEHLEEMLAQGTGHKNDQGQVIPFSDNCRDAINRVIKQSENTMSGIVATFNTPLLIFQNPRVDLATSGNDFDLRDVRKKRMSIYLGVTPDKLKDAAVLINLFFDQLLNLNTRVLPQQDPSLKYQCLLILDEFTAIGKVNMIQQAISYQAGYNMRILTIIQNKSQLEEKYGRSGAITLMANHALMIMYAPSPVVQSDANEYSEMLGYETVISTNKSRNYGTGFGSLGARSESDSEQRRALMLPQEIKELGRWREIVSLENCKPILCDKIKYFDEPAFKERINKPVPAIPHQDIQAFLDGLNNQQQQAVLAAQAHKEQTELKQFNDFKQKYNDRYGEQDLQDIQEILGNNHSTIAASTTSEPASAVTTSSLSPAEAALINASLNTLADDDNHATATVTAKENVEVTTDTVTSPQDTVDSDLEDLEAAAGISSALEPAHDDNEAVTVKDNVELTVDTDHTKASKPQNPMDKKAAAFINVMLNPDSIYNVEEPQEKKATNPQMAALIDAFLNSSPLEDKDDEDEVISHATSKAHDLANPDGDGNEAVNDVDSATAAATTSEADLAGMETSFSKTYNSNVTNNRSVPIKKVSIVSSTPSSVDPNNHVQSSSTTSLMDQHSAKLIDALLSTSIECEEDEDKSDTEATVNDKVSIKEDAASDLEDLAVAAGISLDALVASNGNDGAASNDDSSCGAGEVVKATPAKDKKAAPLRSSVVASTRKRKKDTATKGQARTSKTKP